MNGYRGLTLDRLGFSGKTNRRSAGLSPEELLEKMKSGEIDEAAFEALAAKVDES